MRQEYETTTTNCQREKGADLIIQKRDGTQVRGELIAVKQNSLLLMLGDSGFDASVDIEDIFAISFIKKSKALEGFGLGLLIGAIELPIKSLSNQLVECGLMSAKGGLMMGTNDRNSLQPAKESHLYYIKRCSRINVLLREKRGGEGCGNMNPGPSVC